MNFIFHIIILYFSLIKFSSSLVVLPFELNQITFKNERYSATELAYWSKYLYFNLKQVFTKKNFQIRLFINFEEKYSSLYSDKWNDIYNNIIESNYIK